MTVTHCAEGHPLTADEIRLSGAIRPCGCPAFRRGDKVRPLARVIAANRRWKDSLLTVRLAKSSHLCEGGLKAALHEEAERRAAAGKPELHQGVAARLRREHLHLIREGELYAASGEVASPLCLQCVEPIEPV